MRSDKKKKLMRQLYLGSSLYSNELTIRGLKPVILPQDREIDVDLLAILPFEDLSAPELNRLFHPPFRILDLPEEIIIEILHYACYYFPGSKSRRSAFYGAERCNVNATLDLAYVCKTFYRMAISFLYSFLSIRALMLESATCQVMHLKLYQTLTQNPRLARHCKKLTFDIDPDHYWQEPPDYSLRSGNTDLQRSQGPTHRICGVEHRVCNNDGEHQENCMWAVVQKVTESMDMLEEFKFLYYHEGVVCVKSMCEILTPYRHLKKLTIWECGKRSVCPKVGKTDSHEVS